MDALIPSVVLLIVFLFGSILLFLVCRELILWYWRINEAVDLLTGIRNDLKTIRLHLDDEAKMKLQVPPPGVEYSNSRLKIPEAVKPVFKD